ncbi:hypothetical protein EW146_g8084 [Bondarzewia mesenterica]|uniref:Uncharacterized protein n=1 Tax=Bondarzewia mesenterica TaxID=1095465 RepID=A0A4S4LJ48_9AGAM|nr:hypothetical protein EW146_g8084 [Bondarzewia mesenterica]
MHVQLEASRSPAWKPDAQTPTHPHRCSRSSLPLPLLPATIYERSDPQPRIWNSVHALATRRQRRNTEEQKTLLWVCPEIAGKRPLCERASAHALEPRIVEKQGLVPTHRGRPARADAANVNLDAVGHMLGSLAGHGSAARKSCSPRPSNSHMCMDWSSPQ